jgi:hypothetical protein
MDRKLLVPIGLAGIGIAGYAKTRRKIFLVPVAAGLGYLAYTRVVRPVYAAPPGPSVYHLVGASEDAPDLDPLSEIGTVEASRWDSDLTIAWVRLRTMKGPAEVASKWAECATWRPDAPYVARAPPDRGIKIPYLPPYIRFFKGGTYWFLFGPAMAIPEYNEEVFWIVSALVAGHLEEMHVDKTGTFLTLSFPKVRTKGDSPITFAKELRGPEGQYAHIQVEVPGILTWSMADDLHTDWKVFYSQTSPVREGEVSEIYISAWEPFVPFDIRNAIVLFLTAQPPTEEMVREALTPAGITNYRPNPSAFYVGPASPTPGEVEITLTYNLVTTNPAARGWVEVTREGKPAYLWASFATAKKTIIVTPKADLAFRNNSSDPLHISSSVGYWEETASPVIDIPPYKTAVLKLAPPPKG